MFGFAAFSQVPFSTLVQAAIVYGTASVDATATVTADAYAVLTDSASITATASVSADSIRIRTSNGSVHGSASVYCLGEITYAGVASVTVNGIVTANGRIQGEGWNPIPFDQNTWTDLPQDGNTWTDVTYNDNTWYRQG